MNAQLASQAAAALAADLAEHAGAAAVMETLAGGTAFIAERDGVRLAVIVTPQRADGPLMLAP